MKLPSKLRYVNKHVINKLTGIIARSSWGPLSISGHIGRKSGKSYETPLIAVQIRDGFVIALTYGPDVDWYKNIRAAGEARILRHGKEYKIDQIDPLETKAGLNLFPQPERFILSLVGIKDFIFLRCETNNLG